VDYTVEFLQAHPGFRPPREPIPIPPVVVASVAPTTTFPINGAIGTAARVSDSNRAADLARASGFNRWTIPDLARAEALLIGAGQTPQSNDALAAVQYALSVSPSTQVAVARAVATAPTAQLVAPSLVTTPNGVGVARTLNPSGSLVSALSVVGGASAPGRAGGAAGIVAPPVPRPTNAAVAALTTVEQFFAANPPDP